MLLSDLPYIENVSENESILGGAALTITAYASSEGSTTYTFAGTDVDLTNKNKVTIAKGTGVALAIGTSPDADVSVDCQGFDLVNITTKSEAGENSDYEMLKIIGIDLPH